MLGSGIVCGFHHHLNGISVSKGHFDPMIPQSTCLLADQDLTMRSWLPSGQNDHLADVVRTHFETTHFNSPITSSKILVEGQSEPQADRVVTVTTWLSFQKVIVTS